MPGLQVPALLLLTALPAALATGAPGADAVGLVQTHRSVRNSSQTHSDNAPNHTAKARRQARSIPIDTIEQLSICVYAKYDGPSPGVFKTSVAITISGNSAEFIFHPGSNTARILGITNNQVRHIGFSPARGVYHLLNITIRSNNVHLYQITDRNDAANVYTADFFKPDFYTNDASSVEVRLGHGSGNILSNSIGYEYSYVRDGTHTFFMPAAVGQPILVHSPFVDRSNVDPVSTSHCNAWGDPHYTTYGGTSYDFMGIGVYNFTVSPSDSLTAQVFQCPLSPSRPGVSIAVGMAVRFGQYTITKIGQTTKIEGVAGSTGPIELENGNAYSYSGSGEQPAIGSIDLTTVEASYLVVKGPATTEGFGEIRVKMLGSGAGPMGHVFNVYADLPSSHVDGSAGLCSNTGPHTHVTGAAGLFNAADLATMETACYPSGSGVTPDNYVSTQPTPAASCAECSPAIAVDEAEAACSQVTDVAKHLACQYDYCSTCGDPGVVFSAVEAETEELTGQPYVITPGALIPRSSLPSSVPFDFCAAWGDPHYTTYGGTSYDFMGIGVYEFLDSAGDRMVAQIYQCPCVGTGVNGGGPSVVTGIAVRAGVHTVTLVGQTTKVNGTVVGVGSHSYYGGVDVTVYDEGNGYLHVQGPTSSQGYGEVRVRVFSNGGISPTGYYFNVYGRMHGL